MTPSQPAAPRDGGDAAPAFDESLYTLLSQGAEARVWEGTMAGRPVIVKQRFKKMYRHPALDAKLTSTRLRLEARSMLRARRLGIHTPVLYHVDVAHACIYMERVPGHSLKTTLQGTELTPEERVALVRQMGATVAALHDGGMVHGDLTSSNVLVVMHGQPAMTSAAGSSEKGRFHLVLIDFGLSYFSIIPEDRAVDLYVLERAFTSAHAADGDALFAEFIETYRKTSKNWCSTLNKFADVRMRGRKRSMVG